MRMNLAESLSVYYQLGEASSTDNAAAAYGGLALTQTNSPGVGTGKVGGCRTFAAASTQYFARGDQAEFQTGQIDFTIGAWVNLASKGANRMIVAKDNTGSGNREYDLFYSNGSDAFQANVYTATDTAVSVTIATPSTGQFYFVVMRYEASTRNLYLTVDDPSTAAFTTAGADLQSPGTAQFRIGNRQFSSNPWDGSIDEVFLAKRFFSTEELSWLWNNGNGRSLGEWNRAPRFRHHYVTQGIA